VSEPAARGTVSWRELRAEAEGRLAAAGVDSPMAEARHLTEEASGFEGADLHRHLDEPVTTRGVARFDAMVARRLTGEPLQHVLGRWGFRTLDLAVDGRALIPRPETEQVVDHALAELDRCSGRVVVDLGTGSGAIALSVASERDGVTVWATDRSPHALALARTNLAGLGGRAATRVRLVEGDWYGALPDDLAGAVDVVVSNPPYVGSVEELPAVVADWEPAEALVPGPTGLEAVEAVVAAAPRWLAPAGALVVEIGATQGGAAHTLATEAGFGTVEVRRDLAGRPRVLVARA